MTMQLKGDHIFGTKQTHFLSLKSWDMLVVKQLQNHYELDLLSAHGQM